MKLLKLAALAVVLLSSPALATPQDDDCALAVVGRLPSNAAVDEIATKRAATETVKREHRTADVPWTQISATLRIANLKMTKNWICALNKSGNYVIINID